MKIFYCLILTVIQLTICNAQFQSVTFESGISHYYQQPLYIGGGAVFFDFDNDGWEDMFLTGGSARDRLYLNDAQGGFEDISFKLPYANPGNFTSGAISGDIDNDGCTDLFLFSFDRSHSNTLLLNDCEGNFENISEIANIIEEGPSTGATFLDFDLDGDLDIYVVNYVDTAHFILDSLTGELIGYAHDCFPNYFYINEGENNFREASKELEIEGEGCALAVLSYYTEAKEPAFYTANDFGEWVKPNELFVKLSNTETFIDLAPEINLDAGLYGMGIAMGDIGNDLDNDFYITNIGTNVFLENINGQYVNNTVAYGVENTYATDDLLSTSWGTFFIDVENDNDLDLFVSNGFIPSPDFIPTSLIDPNKLFIWEEGSSFFDLSEEFNLDFQGNNRGCVYSDYDHDGDLDILITSLVRNPMVEPNLKYELYRNENTFENSYVKILLEGVTNNRDGFGSNVYVFLDDGKTLMRTLYSGGTHSSQNSKLIHFGLGVAQHIDSIFVDWPNGMKDRFFDIPVNKNIYLKEGQINFEILGCMDSSAPNYDPLATVNFACKEGSSAILNHDIPGIDLASDGKNLIITSDGNTELHYSIYNLLGQQVIHQEKLVLHDKITLFDVSTLSPGPYFIVLQDEKRAQVFNFVVV